jgi:hypothetical protein
MGDAVWGFLGAILGASIAAVTTYFGTRTTRKEAKRRKEQDELRSARGVQAELNAGYNLAVSYLQRRVWWSSAIVPALGDVWQEQRGVIAPILTNEQWRQLLVATSAIEWLRHLPKLHNGNPYTPLPDEHADNLAIVIPQLQAGIDALKPLTGTGTTPGTTVPFAPRFDAAPM